MRAGIRVCIRVQPCARRVRTRTHARTHARTHTHTHTLSARLVLIRVGGKLGGNKGQNNSCFLNWDAVRPSFVWRWVPNQPRQTKRQKHFSLVFPPTLYPHIPLRFTFCFSPFSLHLPPPHYNHLLPPYPRLHPSTHLTATGPSKSLGISFSWPKCRQTRNCKCASLAE